MRKILNKTVSVLCTLAMCLSLVPCVGYADDVKTTDDFVIDASETVKNVNFAGDSITNSDNFIITTPNQSDFNSNTGEGYQQPASFKYDISSLADKNIVEAYVIWGLTADTSLVMFDVPGDDITLKYSDSNTIPDRIVLGSKISEKVKDEENAAVMFPKRPVDTENSQNTYNMYFEATSYIKKELSENSSYATVMISPRWSGGWYMRKPGAKLYVKTTDAPVVSINVPSEINSNETLAITANITDSNSIKSAEILIDGTAVENAVFDSSAKTVSASVSGLSAGSHIVTVNAVDYWGVTGTASAQVNVKMYLEDEVKTIIDAAEVSNPNFEEQKPSHGFGNTEELWVRTSSAALTDLKAPVYVKYDITSLIDPDNDGENEYTVEKAYALFVDTINLGGSVDRRPMVFFDVPSNDISVSSMYKDTDDDGTPDKYVAPEFNSTELLKSHGGDGSTLFGNLSSEFGSATGSIGSMKLAFDFTDVITNKNGVLSVMLLTSHSNTNFKVGKSSGSDMPKIYVQLIKKPEISLTVSQRNLKSPVTLTAAVTDPAGKIDSVRFYVDGELTATVTEKTDNVYTTSVPGLSKGAHAFKAVAVSGETEKAESAQTFEVKVMTSNITNLYRAIVSNYKENSKVISITKNASDSKWYDTNDKDGARNVWYYQYDVSAFKDIDLSTLGGIKMNMTYSQYLGMSLTAYAMKGDYVINENSAYDEIKGAYPDDAEVIELGKYAGAENNNKEVSLDVTDTLKTILQAAITAQF